MQITEAIYVVVRLKLSTLKFNSSAQMVRMLDKWKFSKKILEEDQALY
jgi:hypothetical protein